MVGKKESKEDRVQLNSPGNYFPPPAPNDFSSTSTADFMRSKKDVKENL